MNQNIFLKIMALSLLFLNSCKTIQQTSSATNKFENEVLALEAKDKTETHADDEILFIGSSSIRLWKDINNDIAPYKGIQRGFGGSNFTDVNYYAERLVYPHKFKALALFVANDITGSANDKTPIEVFNAFKAFEKIVRRKFKNEHIFFIAITPTPLRWQYWPQALQANKLIELYCEGKTNLHFIKTDDKYLDAGGQPIAEYFIGDKLHQNSKGYEVWSGIIKQNFDKYLK